MMMNPNRKRTRFVATAIVAGALASALTPAAFAQDGTVDVTAPVELPEFSAGASIEAVASSLPSVIPATDLLASSAPVASPGFIAASGPVAVADQIAASGQVAIPGDSPVADKPILGDAAVAKGDV